MKKFTFRSAIKTDDAFNVSIQNIDVDGNDIAVLEDLLSININTLKPGEEINFNVNIKRGE